MNMWAKIANIIKRLLRKMKHKEYEYTIKSLEHFVELTAITREETGDYEVFYRGEAEDYGNTALTPSLFRRKEYIANNAVETIIYNEVYNRNVYQFKNDKTVLERLIRMQHYQVPTRLLDITTDPLVALFFAINTSPDKDGFVYLLKKEKDEIRAITDRNVEAIGNIAILGNSRCSIADLFPSLDDMIKKAEEFDLRLKYARLPNRYKLSKKNPNKETTYSKKENLENIRKEISNYFNNPITLNFLYKDFSFNKLYDVLALGDIFAIRPPYNNSRIVAQSGLFYIFGRNAKIENLDEVKKSAIRIPKEVKSTLKKQLDRFSKNEATLYADIEHTSKWILENLTQKTN